jgi:N-acetylglucosamine-6-phosphate deacetylase
VTAWLPTIVSAAADGAIDEALRVLAAGPPVGWVGAIPLGLHLEGPFLAPARRGAHPVSRLRAASGALAAGWSRDGGVAVVTLAPELPGAVELIGELVGRGVVVSLGHSEADEAAASAAVDAGARWVTHLFNAMEPLGHRDPGLVGVALTDDRLHVGLIADGVHVAPRVVGLAQRSLGRRLTLVTDAVGALGMPDGPHRLGGGVVEVSGDAVRLADGTLAGSNLSMDRAVRNLVAMAGCSLDSALHAASGAPAELLGDGSRGRVVAGGRADLVVLGADDQVAATIVGGHVAYAAHPSRWPADVAG